MSAVVDLERARALFDGEALGWIIDRLHTRLERGQPMDARLRLAEPSAEQREALLRLVGRRPTTAQSISIEPAELVAVLARARIAPDLRTLVEALRGPVRDRRAASAAERSRWDAIYRRLRENAVGIDACLSTWADELEATGLLRRLAGDVKAAERIADQTTTVLSRLPAEGVPLPQLAATTLGDSHALDDGSPVSTLVLRAVEILTALPRGDRSAAERRALWARVGVLLDELSAPALVLGLRPHGDSLLAETLRAHASAGEPCRVTLRQLVRHPSDWTGLAHAHVAVCENPAIVSAAADRLGANCPPLVCTEGQPSGAVQTLLAQLATAGVVLLFHTDFDAGGLRIGNLLADRFGARPWRMRSTDYEAALAAGGGAPLTAPLEATWDNTLAPTLEARGQAVYEEQLLDALLADLATWPPQQNRQPPLPRG